MTTQLTIRVCSDLHLEFSDYVISPLPDDQDAVLVLAGDIGLVHKSNLKERYIPFLERVSAQFHSVILIMGNHEHYGGSFRKTKNTLTSAITDAKLANIHLLEKQTHVINGVAFVCATLWTDCDKHSPYAPMLFQRMSDSRVIRTGSSDALPYEHKFSAQASWTDHIAAKRFIFNEIDVQHQSGHRVVVVTHHAPSPQSIHPQYAGDDMNMFYASDMTADIFKTNPALWIHGHTHKQFDYYVDDTRVTCQTRVVANPRGYAGHEDTSGFDQTLTIAV